MNEAVTADMPTGANAAKTERTPTRKRNKKDLLIDILLCAGMILPLLFAIVLKVLNRPATDGIEISGAMIYLTVNLPLQPLYITEAQVNSWAVMITIFFLCLFLTRNLKVRGTGKRQVIAEMVVKSCDKLVRGNMGDRFASFAPFVAAIMALSALSSLSSLIGLYPPTSDINIVAGWAILVFILITRAKMQGGVLNYLKGFTQPVPFLTPFNILSEFATPISMTFRHFGNILSGVVISTLLASALQWLSGLVLGWIPVFGSVPWLQIGLPAIFSIYFDVLSGVLQAFIFAMLTMMYVCTGFSEEDYNARMAKRAARRAAKAAKAQAKGK